MKNPTTEKTKLQAIYATAAILLIAMVGIALGVHGWNSRGMLFDNVNFIDGAGKLLTAGIHPDRGDVSSYGAFATPGPAWFMVPGMLLFEDPRLYEIVGGGALYAGTLLAIFLIARTCFGVRCAYLSILLYGLSASGLFYAGSLWSIGHPFFYVWMFYFCMLWVRRNEASYLAAALVTWSVGMYVDMVLAPIMFVFPALWLIYRPRLRIVPLVLTAAIVLLVWFPYLRFQTTRNFADLKALVQRHRILPNDYTASWCAPGLLLQSASSATPFIVASDAAPANDNANGKWYGDAAGRARERIGIFVEGMTVNFDRMTWSSALAMPMFMLALSTILFTALQTLVRRGGGVDSRALISSIARFGWLTLFIALLFNEFFVAHFLTANGTLDRYGVFRVRMLQAGLIFIGLVLLLGKKQLADVSRQDMVPENGRDHDSEHADNPTLFALGLVVPWLALLFVVESGKPERYWWLWPMQTVAIAAAVTYIPERMGATRRLMALAQVGLVLLMLTHPRLISRVEDWAINGWAGSTATDIQAADYLATQIQSEGKNEAAIGYQVLTEPYMAVFHIVDPRYKVGADLDLYVKHRYGISNVDQCAEGVSPRDEYRILQTTRRESRSIGKVYFDTPHDDNFRVLQQFGDYQVLRRARAFEN